MFAYVCLQTSQVQKTTKSNREVLPCTKPSVRACAHTPLWSINILMYCTHITKIEGLLAHLSALSYVCVHKSLKRWHIHTHTHTQLRRRLQILYIIQHSELFASLEATMFHSLKYIYLYLYIYLSAYTYHLYLYSIIHTFLFCEIPFCLANREFQPSPSIYPTSFIHSSKYPLSFPALKHSYFNFRSSLELTIWDLSLHIHRYTGLSRRNTPARLHSKVLAKYFSTSKPSISFTLHEACPWLAMLMFNIFGYLCCQIVHSYLTRV